jgi:methanogenic corrinoid protein MtbC1/two-component sensor histidine kinase
LRTPLSAIQGFSELLLTQDASPERQRLWLEMINRESVRLSGLIEDMLSLSHIHSGQIDIRLERVELEPIIRQCVEILRIGSSRHNFQLEIAENLPPARTDRDKLIQILNNIIGNAIKYSSKGGTISIKVNYGAANPETLELAVSDEGVGISPDEVPHIFEKFYRVRNSSTKQVKGIGLGLAITRNLVELLGGRIWVESELGKGSTFFFSLPIHTFPHREVKAFKDILLKTLLVEDKDITEAELYLDYLQRTLPNTQLDEVLRDTLYEIGNLWHKGDIGIGDEHLATGVIRDFLARAKTISAPSNGLRMVLGSVAGEEHIVGLTMVGNAFSRAGWTVTNLGANVPVSAFITTIEQSKPHILLLSISLSQRLIEIKRIVNEVREAFPDLLIGVGGRLLNELPDLSVRLGVDFRGTTPDETVKLATQLVQEHAQKQIPLINQE